jgi:hypothetical protein
MESCAGCGGPRSVAVFLLDVGKVDAEALEY